MGRQRVNVGSFRVRYTDGGSEVIQAADWAERGGFHEFYVWMGDKPIVTARLASEAIGGVEVLDAY